MNRDFFQFPSWVVAELNKQAQPKQEAALLKPVQDQETRRKVFEAIDKQARAFIAEQSAKPKRKYTKRAK